MADKKISQLTGATTPVAGTEVLPIVQGGSTKSVSIDNLTKGRTVNATTFDTDVAAAGVTLSGTTLAADGTDTDIDINITPKGAGEVNITKVDIDGGAIDGTAIGANSKSTGEFSKVTSNQIVKMAGAQNGGIAKAVFTRTDFSWAVSAETDLRFYVGSGDTESPGTNVFELNTSGVVTLVNGQLKFPATQNASGNLNTLDDYEEGVVTNITIGATTTDGTHTYARNFASYVKVGRMVTLYGRVSLVTLDAAISGSVMIKGLPFPIASDLERVTPAPIGLWGSLATSSSSVGGWGFPGGSVIRLTRSAAGGATSNTDMVAADLTASSDFGFSITYISAT